MLIGKVPDRVWRSLLTEKPRRMNTEARQIFDPLVRVCLELADLENMRGAHVWIDLDEVARALPSVFGFIGIIEVAHGKAVVFADTQFVER